MALDESTEGLEELNSNGITAYIEPGLYKYLDQAGDIKVDYISNEMGGGFSISVGQMNCGKAGCSCDPVS